MTLKKGFCQQRVRPFGERGSSLVEVLVSMAIGLMLSLFAVYFSAQVKNMSDMSLSRGGFSCHAHLSTVMDRIRAMGHATDVAAFHPWDTARTGTTGLFSMTELVTDAALWTGTPEILNTAATPVAYNGLLIRGSMRALNALFNSAPAGCGAQNISTTPAASLVLGDSALALQRAATSGGVTTMIQIQTYDLASGGAAGCETKPLYLYPPGVKGLSGTDATVDGFDSPYFAKNANYRNNLGFQVSLQAAVIIGSETIQCAATERFAYQQDNSRPANPTITVTENSASTTNAHENNWNVEVNYGGGEKGVVLYCRDRSRLMPSSFACYKDPAVLGMGPGAQPVGSIVSATFPNTMTPTSAIPGPSPTETDATLPASMAGSTRPVSAAWPNDWVPCEQLRVCGRPRETSSTNTVNAASGAIQITNHYQNLRSDCALRVEVVAMDTAGNLNSPDAAVVGYNPTQINSAISQTRVRRPTCGMLCRAEGPAALYGFTNGDYWQSGPGCCTGHIGCAPGNYFTGTGFIYLPLSSDPAL